MKNQEFDPEVVLKNIKSALVLLSSAKYLAEYEDLVKARIAEAMGCLEATRVYLES